jgi:DNA-binding NarL/FixJ family response regulator
LHTRVLVADDHPIYRQGLVSIISESGDFELVGEAEDGRKALDLLELLHPAIAVLDIGMPVMDGLDVMRAARSRAWSGAFVVLTMFKEEEYFREAMELGVKGYLLKEGAASELLLCLRAVAAGRHYVSPVFSDSMLLRRDVHSTGDGAAPSVMKLSPTERRILRQIAENKTSKEIAEELHISFRTVNNHRAHICQKLGLEGPHRLLQFALEHKSLL